MGARAETRIATSKRGQATRRLLLDAGRRVFERDGYLDAKITAIAAEAGVAVGSFYTHFPTKDDLLAAILEETTSIMLYPTVGADAIDDDPVATIERANRAYLAAYEANAALMRVFEDVAAINERFRAMRLERSQAFWTRNTRGIRRLQDDGLADPELDAEAAAIVLSTMVSRMAYGVFALRAIPMTRDLLLDTVTRLWVNALGIRQRT
jgi:AcrR family transcriptional regulator